MEEEAASSSSNHAVSESPEEPPPAPSQPQPQPQRQPRQSITYRISLTMSNMASSPEARDDALSCFVILLTFWFFASLAMALGFYGSMDLEVGPGCSRLLEVSSIFVESIQVTAEKDLSGGELLLYGLRERPLLNVPVAWSETHQVSVPANFHKEWIYYLNKGAHLNISYSVKSEGSNPLNLVIAQGKVNLIQWMENPLTPNTTLSWNLISGNGVIQQNISTSFDYYLAVGNLNNQDIEVLLDIKIETFIYNTTGADYRCSPVRGLCVYQLPFLGSNVAVLSSGERKTQDSDDWYVKLSFGPRWTTYLAGSGLITVVILLVYKILHNLMFALGDNTGHETTENTEGRAPLLVNKEDDNASLGSSYESVSLDEEDVEEWLRAEAARSLDDGEKRQLCVICCDAERDCFFLPCGHSASCYTCGTRISEEAGTCPVCRRKLKKVRRIFSV